MEKPNSDFSAVPENYDEIMLHDLEKHVQDRGDPRSAEEIANDLIENHLWAPDQYIEGEEVHVRAFGYRNVGVPDESGLVMPGRADALEQYMKHIEEPLLVQRLLITTEKAREVLRILKQRGYEINPMDRQTE